MVFFALHDSCTTVTVKSDAKTLMSFHYRMLNIFKLLCLAYHDNFIT